LALAGALLCGYVAPLHGAAAASTNTVVFVTDTGGLNDNGFNHLGFVGTQAGAHRAGWNYSYIQTVSPSDYVKNLTIAASGKNTKMVVAVGFSFGDALKAVAAKFPKVKFVIIDWSYSPPLPNVLGNEFKPEQASYLAGILAAGLSKTHVIGFVGGQNVPLIVAFYAGYRAGALSYDPKVTVLPPAFTGDWVNQSKGKIYGLQEIAKGADVIYPAAGASGLGALTAADTKHVLSIGVDTDQNFLHPNSVVSSVVKHVEVAVASAIVAAGAGKFKAGTRTWDLANDGVGLAPYHGLAGKVPAKVQKAIDAARAGIIAGKITVPTTLK
jgi:basic membrane protein A